MKKKLFIVIGLAVMFLPQLLCASVSVRMLAIFVSSIWMWISCSIELGSLACLAALCLLPGVTSASVFSASFGSSTIMFLIFSFLLSYALSETGVLRRIAVFFIDNRLARKNSHWFMALYFTSMLVVGSFMAPTTVFILYYSIVQEIYSLLGLEKGDSMARKLMVGTGFFASVSCAMTPVAHTFPIMALGYYEASTGTAISYITYLKYGLPIGIILSVCAGALLIRGVSMDYDLSSIRFRKSAWKWQEILSSAVFALVVCCWLITGIWPKAFAGLNDLGTAWPAIIGCIVLCATGCLNVKDGFTKGVSWPAILLCSATLALGSFLTKDEFGVLPAVKAMIEPLTEKLPAILMIVVIVAFTVLLTNLISNIVTTTVSYNLFVPVLLGTASLSPEAATIIIGICASLAYALPSSIAHIALCGSSGWAESKDMLRYGSVMCAVSIVVVCLVMFIL